MSNTGRKIYEDPSDPIKTDFQPLVDLLVKNIKDFALERGGLPLSLIINLPGILKAALLDVNFSPFPAPDEIQRQ